MAIRGLPWLRERFYSEFVVGGFATRQRLKPSAIVNSPIPKTPRPTGSGTADELMVTDPPPISPVKVVPSKLPPPVVSATDPVGPNPGPTPNRANTVGLTNVTWK